MATVDELVVRIRADTRELETALSRADAQTKRAGVSLTGAFGAVNRAVGGLSRSLFSLRGAFVALGLGFSAREVIGLADTYKLLQARVNVVSDGAEDAASSFQGLFEIAQKTGGSLESTAELFTRVARSRRELGVSSQDLLQFTENLQKSIVVSGASATEANAAIIQLGQGLASGTLRGDELRSVMEQMPIVARYIADEMGVSLGVFREMAAEGKVTADVVLRAILARTEEIDASFAKMPLTVGRATQVLRNEFLKLVGDLDAGTSASEDMAAAIKDVADLIGSQEFQKGAADFVSKIAEGVRYLVENKDLLATLGGAVAGFAVGGLPGAAVGGAGGFIASQTEMTRAEKQFEHWSQKVGETREEIDRLEKSLEGLTPMDVAFFKDKLALFVAKGQLEKFNEELVKARDNLDAIKDRALNNQTFFDYAEAQQDQTIPDVIGDETDYPGRDVSKLGKKAGEVIAALDLQAKALKSTAREASILAAIEKASADASPLQIAEIREKAGALYDSMLVIEGYSKAIEEAGEYVDELGEVLDDQAKVQEDIRKATVEFTQDLEQEGVVLQRLLEARKQSELAYRIELEVQRKLTEAKKADLTVDEEKIRMEVAKAEAARKSIDDIGEAERAQKAAARDFANVISTGFEDAILKGENFRDIIKSIGEDLARIALRVTITKPFESALTSWLEGGEFKPKGGDIGGGFLEKLFGGKGGEKGGITINADELEGVLVDFNEDFSDVLTEGAQNSRAAMQGHVTGLGDVFLKSLSGMGDIFKFFLESLELLMLSNKATGGGGGGFGGMGGFDLFSMFGGGAGGGWGTGAGFDIGGFEAMGFAEGFSFGFGKGGVMTSRGPMPLRSYAGGGVANSPQLAMYGEGSMPEAYVPLPDGRSIPVRMDNAESSVTVVQHLNISTGVTQTVRAEVMNMMPQIAEISAQAVREKRFRQPSYFGDTR